MADPAALLYAGTSESAFAALRQYLDVLGMPNVALDRSTSAATLPARLTTYPPALLLLDEELGADQTATILRAGQTSGVPVVVLLRGRLEPAAIVARRRALCAAGAADALAFEQLDADQLDRALRWSAAPTVQLQRVVHGVAEHGRQPTDAPAAEPYHAALQQAPTAGPGLAQLQAILESSRDAAYQIDLASGRFVYCSGAVASVLGYEVTELLEGGTAVFDAAVFAGDRERRAAHLATLIAGEQAGAAELEYRFQTKHRNWRWLSESQRLIRDDHGRPQAIIGTWRDISDVKHTLETLRTSEQRFRRIIETTQEGVLMLDLPGTITYINPRVPQLLGYPRRGVLGHSLFEFVADTHRAAAEAHLVQGEPTRRELPLVHNNGSLVWCIVDTVPLRNSAGEVTSAFSMLLDITERKRAEEELDRFFTLAPNLLCIASFDGHFTRLNAVWEQTLGWSIDEMLRTPSIELVHPDDVAATLREMERAQAGTPSIDFENRYRCRDGSYRTLAWRSAPDSHRRVIYAVAHDITERKQVEAELLRSRAELQSAHDELDLRVRERTRQLEQAKNEAERANAAKSEFLSRMSHELRTPLNSILGFAQIMEMDQLPGKQAERVTYIMKAGRHLLELINEVLDLARVESGRLQVSPEPVCVEHTTQRAIDMIRPLVEQRRQTLVYSWDPRKLTFVRADQQRLAQVLLNLLSNATKYTPDGGEIRIMAERSGTEAVQISVTDTGPGIAAVDVEKLFQPFERLHATFSDVEGTGLGLALSKRLIEAMGGTMGVQTLPGHGCRFWIDLPQTESAFEQAESELAADPPGMALQAPHTVLYIEDNLTNLQVIQHVLEHEPGITLLTAGDGEQGLALARAHLPAVILLDLHLPTVNGDAVLRRLKATPETRAIPVVMISADATPRRIRGLMDAGAADYLTKPLDIQLFLEVVTGLLHQVDR